MPAVENSLGPCRKPKSTIYGWTQHRGVSSMHSFLYVFADTGILFIEAKAMPNSINI
jgi:hypothetical protein